MPHRNPRVESRQRGGRGSGRIAVHQHHVRLRFGQHAAHPGQHGRRNIVEILPPLHDIQVVIGNDPEQTQHLIQHLAVLSADADDRFEPVGTLPERSDQRGHFDRLRPGAENQHDFFHSVTVF